MPFRTAPGTYTNTPLGKELSRTNRLSENKESYPVARTIRATPILGDFGPVNYERFTTPDTHTVIIIILVSIIVLCIVLSLRRKTIEPVDTPEYAAITEPVKEEIAYPSLEGGAPHKPAKKGKRTVHKDVDDFDDLYEMKNNEIMI